MKKYEQIKAKYREKAYQIIDERTFDAAVNEILEENAYLRRLSLHALSGWAMGLSIVNALHENGTKKRQIAYFIKHQNFANMYRKEKDKWRKKKKLFLKNVPFFEGVPKRDWFSMFLAKLYSYIMRNHYGKEFAKNK